MHSSVAFNPDALCLQWERFLHDIYSDNLELVEFVQRYAGYRPTGLVNEEMWTKIM
jgi:hypothetical protein